VLFLYKFLELLIDINYDGIDTVNNLALLSCIDLCRMVVRTVRARMEWLHGGSEGVA
jgi:hypothetical protein